LVFGLVLGIIGLDGSAVASGDAGVLAHLERHAVVTHPLFSMPTEGMVPLAMYLAILLLPVYVDLRLDDVR
jgi:hypothetical protein